jgi:hypothetical protein
MRAPLLLALLLALAAPARAAQPWEGLPWGLGAQALAEALPQARPAALDYGPLTGLRVLPGARLAGLRFRAIFQVDGDGLRQILFERRRRELAPADPARALAGLRARLGPEVRLCRSKSGAAEVWAEAVWLTPEARWTMVLSDFGDPRILTREGADSLHPLPTPLRELLRELRLLAPHYRAGGPGVQDLPRRLLIRVSDPDAAGLASARCPLP